MEPRTSNGTADVCCLIITTNDVTENQTLTWRAGFIKSFKLGQISLQFKPHRAPCVYMVDAASGSFGCTVGSSGQPLDPHDSLSAIAIARVWDVTASPRNRSRPSFITCRLHLMSWLWSDSHTYIVCSLPVPKRQGFPKSRYTGTHGTAQVR